MAIGRPKLLRGVLVATCTAKCELTVAEADYLLWWLGTEASRAADADRHGFEKVRQVLGSAGQEPIAVIWAKAMGLTGTSAFAEAVGISRQAAHQLLCGRSQPSPETMARMREYEGKKR